MSKNWSRIALASFLVLSLGASSVFATTARVRSLANAGDYMSDDSNVNRWYSTFTSYANQVNAELYSYLLQRQQEERIAQASITSKVEIVDEALLPVSPIKPNKKKALGMGLLIGFLLLSFVFVFFSAFVSHGVPPFPFRLTVYP